MAKVTGFKEAKRKLKAMQAATARKVLRRAVNQGALPVVQRARANVPVGNPPYESGDPYPIRGRRGKLRTPGFAKRNIARKTIDTDQGVATLIGVKPEAFYAVMFIELGKSNAPARPWLRPALEQSKKQAEGRLAERLAKLVAKAAAS